jgi:hypothetical protein
MKLVHALPLLFGATLLVAQGPPGGAAVLAEAVEDLRQ